ncbi:unnamed protein product [Schistosoma bovis]|nr:unnamed protein product [Schistosoma bovis]
MYHAARQSIKSLERTLKNSCIRVFILSINSRSPPKLAGTNISKAEVRFYLAKIIVAAAFDSNCSHFQYNVLTH